MSLLLVRSVLIVRLLRLCGIGILLQKAGVVFVSWIMKVASSRGQGLLSVNDKYRVPVVHFIDDHCYGRWSGAQS